MNDTVGKAKAPLEKHPLPPYVTSLVPEMEVTVTGLRSSTNESAKEQTDKSSRIFMFEGRSWPGSHAGSRSAEKEPASTLKAGERVSTKVARSGNAVRGQTGRA